MDANTCTGQHRLMESFTAIEPSVTAFMDGQIIWKERAYVYFYSCRVLDLLLGHWEIQALILWGIARSTFNLLLLHIYNVNVCQFITVYFLMVYFNVNLKDCYLFNSKSFQIKNGVSQTQLMKMKLNGYRSMIYCRSVRNTGDHSSAIFFDLERLDPCRNSCHMFLCWL